MIVTSSNNDPLSYNFVLFISFKLVFILFKILSYFILLYPSCQDAARFYILYENDSRYCSHVCSKSCIRVNSNFRSSVAETCGNIAHIFVVFLTLL